MGILGATVLGLQRAFFGSAKVLLLLWALNLAVALPAALAIGVALEDSIGGSLVDESLTEGFDHGWYGEYASGANRFERTFRPSLVGVGPLLDNLEAWFSGEIFEEHRALLALGAAWALLWALVVGGVLRQVSQVGPPLTVATLFSSGATYFFRMVRLGLLAAVPYYGIYRLIQALFPWVERATKDVTVERTVLFYNLLAAAFVLLLFLIVRVAFDYAKIAIVRENRRSALFAVLRGTAFVLFHPLRTLGLGVIFALLGAALLTLFAAVAPGAGQSSWPAVAVALLVTQLYLIVKIGLRVGLLGAQASIYTGRSRDTIPRPL